MNLWTWRYGRGRPRVVPIAEAERIRSERVSESRIRAAETRKRRSEEAGFGAACRMNRQSMISFMISMFMISMCVLF